MTQGAQISPSPGPQLPITILEKKELSEREKKIIETAMAFPMEQILKRYAKDEELPWDVVLEHEREIKRYLALAAISPGKPLGMAGPIDELWHTFIMFTREYHQFSKLVAGRYLHHAPVTDEEREAPKSGPSPYVFFWKEYCAVFGEEPPAHLWPKPLRAASTECAISPCVINCRACDFLCKKQCNGCSACVNCNPCLQTCT